MCAPSQSDAEKILASVACVLETIVMKNDQRKVHQNCTFSSSRVPDLSLFDYCNRLLKYFQCEPNLFTIVLLTIDELIAAAKAKGVDIVIASQTVHRLLVTSLVIAVKYHEDFQYSNKFYAEVGGISLQELNTYEAAFLNYFDWNLDVSPEKYGVYTAQILSHNSHCTSCGLGHKTDVSQLAVELEQLWPSPQRQPDYFEKSFKHDSLHKWNSEEYEKHSPHVKCNPNQYDKNTTCPATERFYSDNHMVYLSQ